MIKQITFTFCEGRGGLDRPHTIQNNSFDFYWRCNSFVSTLANNSGAPEESARQGYNKLYFTVQTEDGRIFEGRFDLYAGGATDGGVFFSEYLKKHY